MADKNDVKKLERIKDGLENAEMYNKASPMTELVCSLFGEVFPPISAIKEGLDAYINNFQEKKKKEFCDIILSDTSHITSDKVQDITFIIELSRTIDVINRLAQNDKVAFIARLFKKEFMDTDKYDIDRYEEYLHRLDYLSLNEIKLLMDLYLYSQKNSKEYHAEWYDFKRLTAVKYRITEDEVVSIFAGLTMTGFCRESNMIFPSDREIENPIYVTEYFKKFAEMILEF